MAAPSLPPSLPPPSPDSRGDRSIGRSSLHSAFASSNSPLLSLRRPRPPRSAATLFANNTTGSTNGRTRTEDGRGRDGYFMAVIYSTLLPHVGRQQVQADTPAPESTELKILHWPRPEMDETSDGFLRALCVTFIGMINSSDSAQGSFNYLSVKHL